LNNNLQFNKSDPRHKAREIALSALFAYSFNSKLNQNLNYYKEILKIQGEDSSLTKFLYNGVTCNINLLDEIIAYCAPEWPLDQVSKLDLSCLRLAVFELTIANNAPPKVVINEAVELAKSYANDSSGKFVNGVLATVLDKYTIKK